MDVLRNLGARTFRVNAETVDLLRSFGLAQCTVHRAQDLVAEIRRGIFPYVMARCQQAYESGQPVGFGPVILDPLHGLTIGRKTIPWRDLGRVSLEDGRLQVKPKGGGLFSGVSAQAGKIPNLDVLLALVDRAARQYRGAA